MNTRCFAWLGRSARVVLFSLLLSAHNDALAAEVDSVTTRRVELPDSVIAINAVINERIRQGVEAANDARVLIEDIEGIEVITSKQDCDVEDLYTSLVRAIFQAYLIWGLKGYDLDLQFRELLTGTTYSLRLHDSIYRDIDYLEGFSLNLKELTDVARIDGQLVGLDKLGHFFAEGWRYFEISRDEEGGLRDALSWGQEKEEGLYGYTTTGVFSYADLVANFNGWRFFNRILLQQPDPLVGPVASLFDRPYASCDIQLLESIKQLRVVRAWEVSRRFDLRDFIDAAWDEGINCNSYADPLIEAKVKTRIDEVAPGFSCPVDPAACVSARQRYGDFARDLLHPHCLIAQP